MTSRFARSVSAAGAAAAITFAAVTNAHADNTITACVAKNGRIRLASRETSDSGPLRDAPTCDRGERVLTWNVTGPQGPPGPSGQPGPPGDRGETGPPGVGFSGIQYYTVGNGDLRPVGGGLFATSFAPPPGGTFSTAAAPLMAGVHLPQNARVVAMRAHVFDNSASDATIELVEQALSDGTPQLVASAASTGAAGLPYSIDTPLAAPHAVDNALFHYFVRVLPTPGWTASTLQILGVTIAYTLESIPGS